MANSTHHKTDNNTQTWGVLGSYDKGYISKSLFQRLWQRGLHLVTGIRRNMKNYLLPILNKILLRRRFIIETLFDNTNGLIN